MIISHKYQFIFIANPKTGTESIEGSLKSHLDQNDVFISGSTPKKHMPPEKIRDFVGIDVYEKYYKFVFIRNPYDRVVSWYTFLKRLTLVHCMLKKGPINGFHWYKRRSTVNQTFREFLKDERKWLHFQRDYAYDSTGQKIVDFVGRFEQLNDDFTAACKQVALDLELRRSNKSRKRKFVDYREYYDNHSKQIVYNKLKPDFDLFTYDF